MTQDPPDLPTIPDCPIGPAATGYRLEGPEVPFPIEVPVRIRPDLAKMGSEPLLTTDSLWPAYFSEKRQRTPLWIAPPHHHLRSHPGNPPHNGAERCDNALDDYVPLIARQINQRVPHGPVGADLSLPWLGLGPQYRFAHFFFGLAMSLQEDLVLMTPNSTGELIARAMSVCFPSGWAPGDKLGRSFSEIHEPVADSEDIVRAALALSHAMSTKGPFLRYVWTIAAGGDLARPPGSASLLQARSLADCWFRCERQVTLPLEGRGSLFLIRVYVRPLTEMLQAPGRREQILAALDSMTDAVRRYKGLEQAAQLIRG